MRVLTALAVAATLTAATALPARAQTPQARLWNAAIEGDTVALVAAIADGAVVDSLDTRTNPNGRRALNWAAWHNRVDAIRVLLRHGAPIEATNRTGFTPLHHAAEAGSLNAARVLLEAGADPQHPNARGRTPLETAREMGHHQVGDLLAAAIAARNE